MIFDQTRGAERSWGNIDRRRRPPSLPSKDFVLLTRASSEPFEALYSDRLLAGLSALVVDDNATNRRILTDTLRRWQMTVVAAESAPQALSEIQNVRHGSSLRAHR